MVQDLYGVPLVPENEGLRCTVEQIYLGQSILQH